MQQVQHASAQEVHTATTAQAPCNPMRLLRYQQICEILAMSRSGFFAKVAAGELPPPIKIGASSRWLEEEIFGWLKEKIKASRDGL